MHSKVQLVVDMLWNFESVYRSWCSRDDRPRSNLRVGYPCNRPEYTPVQTTSWSIVVPLHSGSVVACRSCSLEIRPAGCCSSTYASQEIRRGTRVLAESAYSDRLTRRSWRSMRKLCEQTRATCASAASSDARSCVTRALIT